MRASIITHLFDLNVVYLIIPITVHLKFKAVPRNRLSYHDFGQWGSPRPRNRIGLHTSQYLFEYCQKYQCMLQQCQDPALDK